MSEWCIIDLSTNKLWVSSKGSTTWGTHGSAERAFERETGYVRMRNHPDFDLVEMTDTRVAQYKQLLEQWLTVAEAHLLDSLSQAELGLYKETRYTLELDPRPAKI